MAISQLKPRRNPEQLANQRHRNMDRGLMREGSMWRGCRPATKGGRPSSSSINSSIDVPGGSRPKRFRKTIRLLSGKRRLDLLLGRGLRRQKICRQHDFETIGETRARCHERPSIREQTVACESRDKALPGGDHAAAGSSRPTLQNVICGLQLGKIIDPLPDTSLNSLRRRQTTPRNPDDAGCQPARDRQGRDRQIRRQS